MTTEVEESTTNDVNAMDDNGQDLDFLASAFEEVATANETDLFASVDPSLVSFFCLTNIFPSFWCVFVEKKSILKILSEFTSRVER